MIFVNGVAVKAIVVREDFEGFQFALLSSSFATWVNQSPSHAAVIAASFAAQNLSQVRSAYAQLAALYPPTQAQLSEWQSIADDHHITSLRFVPS